LTDRIEKHSVEVTEKNSVAVCLDVGGTSLKSGLVTEDGSPVPGSLQTDPVDSGGSADSILFSFSLPVRRLLAGAAAARLGVIGIGIAICGPFDYERGISLMKGVGKYDALYGMNVKERLRGMLGAPDRIPLRFDIDSSCFARGEVCYGAGVGWDRVIVFTIGSGLGSAFAVDRRIVLEGPGVPWLGWIAGQPHRGGILNDFICRDALLRRFHALGGSAGDVEEISRRARAGQAAARRVFEEMGVELGGFLATHNVEEFGARCLVFGGRISHSFDLFAGSLRQALAGLRRVEAVLPAADIETSALKGAARYVFETSKGGGHAPV
jgi:glucokinase